MRPIPIPDHCVGPGTRRVVIAPPDGDFCNPKISAVEALAAIVDDGLCMTMLVALEDGDLKRLRDMARDGGTPAVWLSMYCAQIPPFAVEVADGAG